jgi:hypothetical protein
MAFESFFIKRLQFFLGIRLSEQFMKFQPFQPVAVYDHFLSGLVASLRTPLRRFEPTCREISI